MRARRDFVWVEFRFFFGLRDFRAAELETRIFKESNPWPSCSSVIAAHWIGALSWSLRF